MKPFGGPPQEIEKVYSRCCDMANDNRLYRFNLFQFDTHTHTLKIEFTAKMDDFKLHSLHLNCVSFEQSAVNIVIDVEGESMHDISFPLVFIEFLQVLPPCNRHIHIRFNIK